MKTTFLLALAIAILSTSSLVFAQDTTLTITNSGRVGIGTTNPATTLDISGQVQLSGTLSATPPTGLGYGIWGYSGVGLGIYSQASGSTQGIGFWTKNGTSSPSEVVRILSNGNVGIGTTNPGQLLHVAGGTIEVYPASDGTRGIRLRSADQTNNFIIDMRNDGTMQIGANSGLMQLASTFGVDSRNLSGTWRPMRASSFDVQSSRQIKQDILHLQSDDATSLLTQLMQLKPATYRYIWQNESEIKTLGFIAEELPDVIRSDDRRGVNLYALSTATVAALQAFYLEYLGQKLPNESAITQCESTIASHAEEINSLRQRISELEALVKSLVAEKGNRHSNSMTELR